MRRREPPAPVACERCGEEDCEAMDAEQCEAFAHLADQRARFARASEAARDRH